MQKKYGLRVGLVGLGLLCVQSPGFGFDAGAVEFANGNRTRVFRIAGQIRSPFTYALTQTSKIDLAWELSLAYWRARRTDDIPGARSSIVDLGFTPALRWIDNAGRGVFGEAGVGVHGLSETYSNNGRELSTSLQFISFLGIGYVFQNQMALSLRVEHVSNGSIKRPNDGVNFVGLRIARPF